MRWIPHRVPMNISFTPTEFKELIAKVQSDIYESRIEQIAKETVRRVLQEVLLDPYCQGIPFSKIIEQLKLEKERLAKGTAKEVKQTLGEEILTSLFKE